MNSSVGDSQKGAFWPADAYNSRGFGFRLRCVTDIKPVSPDISTGWPNIATAIRRVCIQEARAIGSRRF